MITKLFIFCIFKIYSYYLFRLHSLILKLCTEQFKQCRFAASSDTRYYFVSWDFTYAWEPRPMAMVTTTKRI